MAGAAAVLLGLASSLLPASLPGASAAQGTGTQGASVRHVIALSGTSAMHTLPSAPARPRRGPDPAQWVTPVRTGPAARKGTQIVTHSTQQTLNWSGEMATGAGFTGVHGSWTVPSVTAAATNHDSATWIGIGGGSRSATGLIQTGTDQHTSTGTTTYSAWYEILPSPSVTIIDPTTGRPVPVSPGDQIRAEILQQTSGAWLIQIEDVTKGWLAHGTFTYTGTTATAEWIEEAPSLNTSIETLADFHSAHFTDMQDTPSGTQTLVALQMVTRAGTVIAYPGMVRPTTTRSVTIFYGAPSTPGGTTPPVTTPPVTTPPVTTPPATTPPTAVGQSGYDLVGSDGGVFVFDPPGTAGGFFGSLPALHVVPAKPIVGMVATVNDKGYWLVGSDGGVFAFGNAPFLGSLPGMHVVPAQPITGIVAAHTGQGYFLVGRDGGVFTFGAVPFLGSLPADGIRVHDIVGIAATPSGNGYWLVASTGQVYAFGAATHLGTALGTSSPVSAISGTTTGGGYWVTTTSGAVHAFGNAKSFGTLPSSGVLPYRPVVGIVHTVGAGGYWLVGADGGVFSFGDAPFIGALPSIVRVDDIVGAVATTV